MPWVYSTRDSSVLKALRVVHGKKAAPPPDLRLNVDGLRDDLQVRNAALMGSASPAFLSATLYLKSTGGGGPWPLSKADEVRGNCATVQDAQEHLNCPDVAGTAQNPFVLEVIPPGMNEDNLIKKLKAEK
eukprot:362000-Chlamydomonas_euryale.AAC.5